MIDFLKLPSYELIKQERLDGVQSEGYLLRHKKSGARVLLLENADENKVFSIGFRTTPSDSTGVAHILEHSVLCGSTRYPVKDPFVELVKGSMNTFLNAITYPDKTIYPVASCNDQDFANLMGVYMDAVLYPNIYQTEEIFLQEGWSLQIEDPEDDLVFNGVVYNEMKGAFSSPEAVLERGIMNELFPDTTYNFDSGGDPACIPDLTYEDFLDFHRRYYHPSNSYIYLYGDMDFVERLDWLDREYLGNFSFSPVDSRVRIQKPFDEMRMVRREYAVGDDEPLEDNTYLTCSFVIGESTDTRLANAFAVLEYVLLSSPGAPLKEALLEAGIGHDVTGSYDSGTAQPIFTITAIRANEQDESRFARVVRDTLESLAGNGLDKKALEAGINLMEFRFREADYGSFPKGLIYASDLFDSWLYDDEKPFDYLRSLEDFAFLRSQIETGYFEGLIRRYILDNTHSLLLTAVPRRGLTAENDRKTREKLQEMKASLTSGELDEMIKRTDRLRAFQETPSPQEELEKIPMLTREDLNRKSRDFSNTVYQEEGVTLVHHDYPTNGIVYLNLLHDVSVLEQEELPWLGLLRAVLGSVDTGNFTYGSLSNEINARTGGISSGISLYPGINSSRQIWAGFGLQVRALEHELSFCFDMIGEILLSSDLCQEKRLREIIQSQNARMAIALEQSGHATAAARASSAFSANSLINDLIAGVSYFDLIHFLAEHFDEEKERIGKKLHEVLDKLLSSAFIVSYTGDGKFIPQICSLCAKLSEKMRKKTAADGRPAGKGTGDQQETRLKELSLVFPERHSEALRTAGQVQYVARCGNFRDAGFEPCGAMNILHTLMSYEYLWKQVRVVGGAYGCSGRLSKNGNVTFVSYRDPHLARTNRVFENIPEFLESFDASERDMTKYVIGTISNIDLPMSPSQLASRSMMAWVTGLTVDMLQKSRGEILSAAPQDIRNLAEPVRAALEQQYLCVIGNAEKIDESRDLFEEVRDLQKNS